MKSFERLAGASAGIFRNMALLSLGTIAARAVGVLALPLLTRLYSPKDFGVLAIFMAIAAVITPIATFFATAIPLPRRDRLALDVVVLAFASLAVMVAVSTIIFASAGALIFSLLKFVDGPRLWPILVLAIALTGTFQILMQWGTRRKAFASIAWASTAQAISGTGVKIALGFAGLPVGLVLGQVVQTSAGAIQLAWQLLTDARKTSYSMTSRGLKRAVRRFADFPTLRLPSQLLMAFTGQALMLFSASLFDVDTVGQIMLAVSVLALPISLIGTNIGQAYYGEVAAVGKRDRAKLYELTKSVIVRLTAVSIVPALVLFVGGPYLFRSAFGEEWTLAGEIASWSATYVAAAFVSLPIIHLLNVLGHQKYYLRINAVRASWTVMLFVAADVLNWGVLPTITAYYLMLSAHLLLVIFAILRLIKRA